jgi:hypothetical protein
MAVPMNDLVIVIFLCLSFAQAKDLPDVAAASG